MTNMTNNNTKTNVRFSHGHSYCPDQKTPHGFGHSPNTSIKKTTIQTEKDIVDYSQNEKYFGMNVFHIDTMKRYISSESHARFVNCLQHDVPFSMELYDDIAHGMMAWARERGATHFTHWFQPLNSASAEKHDAFLDVEADGITPVVKFKGKQLALGETDGSSFPNGGIRSTARARA